MNKKIGIFILIMLFIDFMIIYMSHASFALEYTGDNPPLFYKEDMKELSHDIEAYIKDIDDFLIPNSTFLYSNNLSENYDALVNIAMAYVIYNNSLYEDKIVKFDGKDVKYISLDEIYNITEKYFGISNFTVINRNTIIKDNYISLVLYNEAIMDANIKNINTYKEYEYIVSNVVYDNGDSYRYIFKDKEGILKLYNIEVAA